ncbi:DoxX family protein [Rhizobium metallidurans]|uniref:Putative oxidoreductase n=1 Tax=Rhizobium metallidurans TaxID=1265931 RepID=A0A7W6CTH6_9HYPH|nr:DoxX family protein [Rhizobium metallidurans]MBB3964863.1 putative oxidoreductase [Rhizobium metallidurans]
MERSLIRSAGANTMLLAGRLLLSAIFLHEGATLALDFSATVETFARLGLDLPVAIGVILLQLAAGLSVAAGLATRLGATALGIFCLLTAVLFHTDFASRNELLHFEKDFAIAGGMFVLAISGAGSLSIDAWLKRSGPTPIAAFL